MDLKTILMGLLSTTLKMDNGQIEELLNEEGATEESVSAKLKEMDAQRVATLKMISADSKEGFNQGYAKAKKEEREKFEAELRAEYGIDSQNTGIDLIKDIISANAGGSGASGQVTEDDVKKHPAFLSMERTFKKQIEDLNTEHTNKLTEIEAANKRNETFHGVRQKAVDLLATLNPVESQNPNVASNLRNTFVNSLKDYDFEQQPDGTFLVLKDGKRYDDAHGHAIAFEDIVKQVAGNYYEFQSNSGGSNGGNENKGGQGAAGVAKTFKTEEEAQAYARDSSVPLAERMAALAAFTGSKTEPDKE